jgi:hypothetical protein
MQCASYKDNFNNFSSQGVQDKKFRGSFLPGEFGTKNSVEVFFPRSSETCFIPIFFAKVWNESKRLKWLFPRKDDFVTENPYNIKEGE